MTSNYTPIIQQYLQIKSQYKDMILVYRMGDFYEFFFEDAIKVSKILNIALAKRYYYNNRAIPMAGFPYHVLDNYLLKLVQNGESLAICEQIDKDNNLNEYSEKKILNRQVVRIMTPGTICEDNFLYPKTDNIIAAIFSTSNNFGYSTLDITTGNFLAYEISNKYNMLIKLQLTNPVEILHPENFNCFDILKNISSIKSRPEYEFDLKFAKQELTHQFNIFNTDCFGWNKSELAIKSAGCLLHYVKKNYNLKKIPHIRYLKIIYPQDTIMIDYITVKNLQLIDISPQTTSLFKILDNNCTNMGSRLLKRWLLNPIRDIQLLKSRQNSISYLINNFFKMQNYLKNIGDLERVLARLSLCNVTPRDLVVLRKSLKCLPQIKLLLKESNIPHLIELNNKIKDFDVLYKLLENAIVYEPPFKIQEGGVIAKGYNSILDNLRELAINQDNSIKNWENREKKNTGIHSLKIMFNNTHGYFIQIKKSLSSTIKLPKYYTKIQTLTRSERYITLELKEYESKINKYKHKSISVELFLYANIINKLFIKLNELLSMSEAITEVDLLTNLAERAVKFKYVCPKFTNKKIFKYSGGRHPLVEYIDNNYVKNDLFLSNTNNTLLITGPNMGGKSTYMKQTALIAIMSYIGSFIPADSALIGPIDCIFTRMGVNDDLSSGKSTFMVEMIETAYILNNSTKNSLILIDEIGRGTNNLEGISIAWGCIEHLVNINSFNLIATHYIELTKISDYIPKVKNIHFSISTKNNKILFLHKLKNGALNKSCGIIIAEIAGLPKNVINNATKKFETFHKKI